MFCVKMTMEIYSFKIYCFIIFLERSFIIIKFSVRYFFAFIIILAIEVVIALFVHDDFIRPFVGDAIVVVLLYTFIRSFIQKKIAYLPLYVFLFAVFVEILQYFNIVNVLGLGDNVFLCTIIGTTFDVNDIISYFFGMVALFVFQFLADLHKNRI